jgi:hypothetical protein
MTTHLKPTHPGEILREEILIPLNLNAHKVAMALHVPAPNGLRNCERRERCFSRNSLAACALFQNHAGILDQLAKPI